MHSRTESSLSDPRLGWTGSRRPRTPAPPAHPWPGWPGSLAPSPPDTGTWRRAPSTTAGRRHRGWPPAPQSTPRARRAGRCGVVRYAGRGGRPEESVGLRCIQAEERANGGWIDEAKRERRRPLNNFSDVRRPGLAVLVCCWQRRWPYWPKALDRVCQRREQRRGARAGAFRGRMRNVGPSRTSL